MAALFFGRLPLIWSQFVCRRNTVINKYDSLLSCEINIYFPSLPPTISCVQVYLCILQWSAVFNNTYDIKYSKHKKTQWKIENLEALNFFFFFIIIPQPPRTYVQFHNLCRRLLLRRGSCTYKQIRILKIKKKLGYLVEKLEGC